MNLNNVLSFVVTFIVSVVLVPVVGNVTKKMGIIAQTNNRTVHHGIIPRTGGYAIYASFLIGAMFFLKTDTQINSMMIGGFIIFLTGLYDDIHDISPKMKLLGQVIAALVVIFYGSISLKGFTITFLPSSLSYAIAIVITILWIVGITNAVNLIDGLDGLCAGISIIVLFTISMTSLYYGRTDITSLSLMLAGAIAGFLVYNFHPAKIFMGDCGALFIGFMISVISLLGFGYKSTSFFTLGAPIVVLAVPIMDTLIAIVRRKVHHKKFSEADRGHLHHQLMFNLELGQTKSVLILYLATFLFSICSYLYINHKIIATILFLILMLIFEIFVEATNMIGRRYKPVLTFANIFIQDDRLPSIKDTKSYAFLTTKKAKRILIVVLVLLIGLSGSMYYSLSHNSTKQPVTTTVSYKEQETETKLMKSVYDKLTVAKNKNNKSKTCKYLAVYFALDYYTRVNKEDSDIGGLSYFYKSKRTEFKKYAKESYYSYDNTDAEVISYQCLSVDESTKKLKGLSDYSYYDVTLSLMFNASNPAFDSDSVNAVVTLIDKDNKFYVVSLESD